MMKIRFNPQNSTMIAEYPDLTVGNLYRVISIECDDYRIMSDEGRPYVFPHNFFEIEDPTEPDDWITEYGEEGERYAAPPELSDPGFFERYFDHDPKTIAVFRRYLQKTIWDSTALSSVSLIKDE